jgi:hypothetical protein
MRFKSRAKCEEQGGGIPSPDFPTSKPLSMLSIEGNVAKIHLADSTVLVDHHTPPFSHKIQTSLKSLTAVATQRLTQLMGVLVV